MFASSLRIALGLEDNPLQTAVLNLFITMKYRFPNLVVGMLTRESVRKALSNGISAEQVSEFH
jgi:transcription initiation factor TFIIH subunit 4